MNPEQTIDYNHHWMEGIETYRSHPTSRHRRRFVMNALALCDISPETFIFDYGCGTGLLLIEAKEKFGLRDEQLGGCDISEVGIQEVRQTIASPYFFHTAFPELDRPIHVAICTEVIEHTADYHKILRWIAAHLASPGHFILTTPGVPMDPPDEYYGHIQHFEIEKLAKEVESLGFIIKAARLWGYPFFSLQKWLTKRYFDHIRDNFMLGELSLKKRVLFNLAYRVYFIHDYIDRGTQIFMCAQKP